MPTTGFRSIDRQALEQKLQREQVDNQDRVNGFALVNVLSPKQFAQQHIPGSINIPQGQEDRFEERFDTSKDIVVYCASPQCDASPKAARELARRGFQRVQDYEAGLSDWKDAGNDLSHAA